jgi:hypothetical protein
MVSSLSPMIAAMLLQLCPCRDQSHSLDSLLAGIRRNVNLIAIHRSSIVKLNRYSTNDSEEICDPSFDSEELY